MLQGYFSIAFFGLITSFAFALLISTFFRLLNRPDLDLNKKRAAHALPTSRLGGLGVGASILLVILLNDNVWHLEIAIASFPIFITGLMEDFGKPMKPKHRLAVGALSAAIFIFFKSTSSLMLGLLELIRS